MSKITQGPWYAQGKYVMYNKINAVNGRDSSQQLLAEIYSPEAEANAQVIASAPEMLEALTAAFKCYEVGGCFDDPHAQKAMVKIREALQKAGAE